MQFISATFIGLFLLSLSFQAATSDKQKEACLAEAEVEDSEEGLVEDQRTELLQRGSRLVKAGSPANLQLENLEPTQEEDAKQEEALVAQMKKQETDLAKVSQDVQSSKEAMIKLIERRHEEKSALQKMQDPEGPTSGPVNCTAYPMFCNEKVNCAANPLTKEERKTLNKRLATADGHGNLRAWCLSYPMYATSVQKCITEGDTEGYAKEMYASQTKLHLNGADAIYCFVSGHCNNTEVTAKSTREEAEHACDKLYGHENWTNTGFSDFVAVMTKALEMGKTHQLPKEWKAKVTGWNSLVRLARDESRISAMTACAMGNFQCDIAYCQANYCNNPGYKATFGNLSWAIPDHD